MNEVVYGREPGIISAAEESTAWPGVSRPTYLGGLGFGFKWNMGWMHDTLGLLPAGPDLPPLPPPRADVQPDVRLQRELHPAALPRRGRARQGLAATARCPATAGRSWPTCGRCTPTCGRTPARSCCSWAASSPRSRSGATSARSTGTCSSDAEHAGMQSLVRDLNHALPRPSRRCGSATSTATGFWWLEANDADRNVRRVRPPGPGRRRALVCVANLSPVPREGYRVGLPQPGALARGAQHRRRALRRSATSATCGGVERRADRAGTTSRSRPS